MQKPFRFGVQLAEASSRADWIAQVQEAEGLGFDVVVLPDHVADHLAPFPAIVSAAEATEKVRLGTYVLDVDFRNPVLLAQEAATVDLLTDGRLELGLGAGWLGRDYDRLGIPFDPPGVRLGRLTETIEILSSYFRGAPFKHAGTHYTVEVFDPKPSPAQGSGPPLALGGGGKRILSLAARQADIVSVFLRSRPDGSGFDESLTAANYERTARYVSDTAAEAGRDPELNVLVLDVVVTRDRPGVAAALARSGGWSEKEALSLPFHLVGTAEQMADDLIERRERFGISYITVFGERMRAFAPVIERLAGT